MKIGNNTYQTTENGTTKVRLHNTVIYERDLNGTVRLYTGGWRTVTTKRRLNTLLEGTGWKVYADKGVWKVGKWTDDFKTAREFVEGITL